ncbi:MAG TPA: hypothetical protein VGK37_13515 [Casimicrobiaceae bacterium]|jgi:hypothetical protein
MARISNEQPILKPQDFVVALKIALIGDEGFPSYISIAAALSMSASEVHGSAKRARQARLLQRSGGKELVANRAALREFALHGVPYAYPPRLGPVTRGIPTASGAPSLVGSLMESVEVPVWPHPAGQVRGPALYPLYPSVPRAAEKDSALYDLLSLVDAIRIGTAREREIAAEILERRLS